MIIRVLITLSLGIGCAMAATLTSPHLQLEVQDDPFAISLRERGTGRLVIDHRSVTIGNREANRLQQLAVDSTSYHAELQDAEGTVGTISFGFSAGGHVLDVSIEGNGAITHRFDDAGGNYYGVNVHQPDNRYLTNNQRKVPVKHNGKNAGTNWSSARAPFFINSSGYGVYVPMHTSGSFEFFDEGWSVEYHHPKVNYHIIVGPDLKAIYQQYVHLGGHALMPPDWALMGIFWRDDYNNLDTNKRPSNAQSQVIKDADQLRAQQIHAGGLMIDRPYATGHKGWGNMDFSSSFPNPPQMIQAVNDRGLELLLWITNRFSSCSVSTYADSQGWLFDDSWPAVDVRIPQAFDYLKDRLDEYASMGIKGYKIDRGDEGEMPDDVTNEVIPEFLRLQGEGLAQRHPNDWFSFARTHHDSSRQYAAFWNGDTKANWLGLETTVIQGLRSGLMNFPIFGSDTAGYFSGASNELRCRWIAYSAWSPMFEILIDRGRTPWYDFDTIAQETLRESLRERYLLLPYLRSLAYQAHLTGWPMMRPMFLEFPNDQQLSDTWDQFMLGDGLIVAPVVKNGQRSRPVYLPTGRWMDYYNRETIYDLRVGGSIDMDAPLTRLPVFIREGAIIPRGRLSRFNDNWTPNWQAGLEIEVFPSGDRETTFPYYNGSQVVEITCTPTPDGFSLACGDLALNGEWRIFCTEPEMVILNDMTLRKGDDYSYDATTKILSIPYSSGSLKYELRGSRSIFSENRPPHILEPAQATPNPVSGPTTTLSALAQDPDGNPLTYTWVAEGPAPVTPANPTGPTTEVTFSQAGRYTFTLNVNDGRGGSHNSTLNVDVVQTPSGLIVSP